MVLLPSQAPSHSHSNSRSNSSAFMHAQAGHTHASPNRHNKSASASSPASYSPADSPAAHMTRKHNRQSKGKHSDSYLSAAAAASLYHSPATSASSSPSTSPFLHSQSYPSPASTATTVSNASNHSPPSSLPDSPVQQSYNLYMNAFHERDSLSSLSHRFDTPTMPSTGNRSRRSSLRHSSRDSKQEGGFPLNARKLNAFLDLGTCDGNESNGSGLCLGGRNRICPYTDLKTPSLAQLAQINLMQKEQRPQKLEDIADAVEDRWPTAQHSLGEHQEEKENEDLAAHAESKRTDAPSLAEALRMLNPRRGEPVDRLILPLSSSSLSFASLSDSIKNGACVVCAVYLVTFPDSSSASYHWLLSHGPVEYSDQLINRLREKTLHKKQDIRFSTLWVKLAKEAAKTVPYAESGMSADSKCEEKDAEHSGKASNGGNAKSKANDEISREILVGFFESFKNINSTGEVLHRQNFQRIEFDLYEMLKRHQITKQQWKLARNSFALHSFKPFVDREEQEVEAYLAENNSDEEEEVEVAHVPSPTLSASSSFSSNASAASTASGSSSLSSSRKRPSIRLCGKTLFTFNVVSGELTCIATCSQVAAEDSRYCAVCIHKVLQKKRMLTCLNYRECNNHAYQRAHVVVNVLAQRDNLSKAMKAQLRLCQFCMIQEQFRLLDDEMAYGEGHGAAFQPEVKRLEQMKAKMDANMDAVAGEMVANVLEDEQIKVPQAHRNGKLSDWDEEPDEDHDKGPNDQRYPHSSQGNTNRRSLSQSPAQPSQQQFPSGNHSTYALVMAPPQQPALQQYVPTWKGKEAAAVMEEKYSGVAPAYGLAPAASSVFLPYPASLAATRPPAVLSAARSNAALAPVQEYPRLSNRATNGNGRISKNVRSAFPPGATMAG